MARSAIPPTASIVHTRSMERLIADSAKIMDPARGLCSRSPLDACSVLALIAARAF
jgi:hypothetical protein